MSLHSLLLPLSRAIATLVALVALVAVAPGSAPAPVPAGTPHQARIELKSGRTLEGPLVIATPDRLTLQVGDQQESVALDELLLLSLDPAAADPASPPPLPPQPPGAPDLVFLARTQPVGSGDRLVGRLQGGDEFGVMLELDGAGPFSIPFDDIERLLPRADLPVDRLAALEGAGADDRVWRRKPDGGLDHVAGVVERLDGDTLVFNGAVGPMDFALPEVAAVVLGGNRASAKPLAGRPVLVRLRGGSRLAAGLLELGSDRVVLSTPFAERLELPLSALASLLVRGPDVVLVAELPPVEVKQWPTIGRPEDFLFPWHADLSVTGRLLSVGGIPRASGLGVHANASLTFTLPERAQHLRITGGLVDEVGELPATGSVRFTLLVDGKQAAQSAVVSEGQEPVVLRLDGLTGGARLELLADDGGDDDAGDRAAWVDGVILLGA